MKRRIILLALKATLISLFMAGVVYLTIWTILVTY